MLKTIINYMFSIIDASVMLCIVGCMFPTRFTGIKKILFFFTAICLGSLAINLIEVNVYLSAMALLVIFILLCQVLYKGSIHIKLFYLLFGNYVLLASEMILANIILLLPESSVLILLKNIKIETFFSVLVKMLIMGIGIVFAKYFIKLQLKLEQKYWYMADVIFIIMIELLQISIYIESNLAEIASKYLPYSIVFTLGILILSIFVIYFLGKVCWIYEKQHEINIKELRNNELNKIIAYQENVAMDLKSIRHDIYKNLTNISYLLEKNKIHESISYINNINDVLENTKVVINSGNYVIDAILNYYIAVCKNKNIDLEVSVDEITNLNVEPVDISAILNNLIDNAIEAVGKIEHNSRNILLKIFCYKNNLTILVENLFDGNILLEAESLKTTKAESEDHGIGIKSIKNATEKNDGTFKYYIVDNKFSVIVMLPLDTIT